MLEGQNSERFPQIELPNGKKITLYKNGNNDNIYYYFRFGKKSYRGSTGTSNYELSKQEGFKVYTEISTGKRKSGSQILYKFENVIKKYLNYLEKEKTRKPSQRTLNDYKRYSKFLLEKFRGRQIETLCDVKVYRDYQKWRTDYYNLYPNKKRVVYKRTLKGERKQKKLYGRTINNVGGVPVNREIGFLVSVLKYSKYELHLLPNIDIPIYKDRLRENHGKKILGDKDYENLRDYMSVNRPFQWMIISFINSTGVRYGEIPKITWGDVDWETPCVWIRKRKNPINDESLDTPVPLVGTSLEILKTLWERENVSKEPESKVFVNDKGVPVKSIRRSFKYCLKQCGIDESFTIYSFRSRFVTRMCLRDDIPVVVLSKILGHKSTEMVMKHYESLNKDHYVKVLTDSRENFYKRKKEKEKEEKQKLPEQQNKTDIEPDVPDFV